MTTSTPQNDNETRPSVGRQDVLRELASLKWRLINEILRTQHETPPGTRPPLWRVLSDSGFTLPDLSILSLFLRPGGTVTATMTQLGLSRDLASSLVSRLESRGLIQQTADEGYGEAEYSVTASGRRNLDSIAEMMRAELFRSLGGMDTGQLETLFDAVRFFLSTPGLPLNDDSPDVDSNLLN